jgi:hypothetical protein
MFELRILVPTASFSQKLASLSLYLSQAIIDGDLVLVGR